MRDLCRQIETENDAEKFAELARELNDLIDVTRERILGHRKPTS